MIYLASPYSHPDPAVREQRYFAACRATATLVLAGVSVFSPVVHSHPLVEYGLPTDWSFWERCDREMLAQCDGIVVLTLDGWQDSLGVREEMRIALELGRPVHYLAPEDARGSPTLAHVASWGPGADPTPTGADCPPTLAHVASEVPA